MEVSIKYSFIWLKPLFAVEPEAKRVFALLQNMSAMRPDIWSIWLKYGHVITRYLVPDF
jgi:hypothetical protein